MGSSYGYDRSVQVGSDLRKYLVFGILGIILLLFCVMVGCSSVTTIPAGHVGVVTKFGRVTGQTVYEGMHFIDPLASVTKMTTQTTEIKESASVPSQEGLILTLEASLLYHLNGDSAAKVYQTIGENYQEKIVEPTLRSAIREATASHAANALYSSERDQIAQEIVSSVNAQLGSRGFIVEKVLMRDVQLPLSLKQAIEQKQQADQEQQAMTFRLQKEKQEAERKRIEAQGIKDFQTIVSQGINADLLKWKGIEATEKLAESQNSKIVIIGGKDGLPVILNNQ